MSQLFLWFFYVGLLPHSRELHDVYFMGPLSGCVVRGWASIGFGRGGAGELCGIGIGGVGRRSHIRADGWWLRGIIGRRAVKRVIDPRYN